MHYKIEYCVTWNYFPAASRAADEIKTVYPDAQVELIESGGGIFDVTCDTKMVYSKKNTRENRFPEDGEIASLVKNI